MGCGDIKIQKDKGCKENNPENTIKTIILDHTDGKAYDSEGKYVGDAILYQDEYGFLCLKIDMK